MRRLFERTRKPLDAFASGIRSLANASLYAENDAEARARGRRLAVVWTVNRSIAPARTCASVPPASLVRDRLNRRTDRWFADLTEYIARKRARGCSERARYERDGDGDVTRPHVRTSFRVCHCLTFHRYSAKARRPSPLRCQRQWFSLRCMRIGMGKYGRAFPHGPRS
jgi:hypothetical protein